MEGKYLSLCELFSHKMGIKSLRQIMSQEYFYHVIASVSEAISRDIKGIASSLCSSQ